MNATNTVDLAEIEEHIAKGQMCVAHQKRLIAQLVADRGDVKEAWQRLVMFEDVLDEMLEHRQRLLGEIRDLLKLNQNGSAAASLSQR
jgi:hypothetical protein